LPVFISTFVNFFPKDSYSTAKALYVKTLGSLPYLYFKSFSYFVCFSINIFGIVLFSFNFGIIGCGLCIPGPGKLAATN